MVFVPNQVGVLGLSLYNVTNNLLMLQAWYAVFVFGLVPLGVIFFSFAAGCAIKGIFSLLLGKAAATSLLHTAGGFTTQHTSHTLKLLPGNMFASQFEQVLVSDGCTTPCHAWWCRWSTVCRPGSVDYAMIE